MKKKKVNEKKKKKKIRKKKRKKSKRYYIERTRFNLFKGVSLKKQTYSNEIVLLKILLLLNTQDTVCFQ